MKIIKKHWLFLPAVLVYLLIITCGKVPVKKFYVINYEPEPLRSRQFQVLTHTQFVLRSSVLKKPIPGHSWSIGKAPLSLNTIISVHGQ